jgi:arabinoxylan arabinofuranohydrolase
MKFFTTALLTIVCAIAVQAQNPIVPSGTYLADPSARVFNGKLYLYTSKDTGRADYCSHRYDILSTTDMKHWTLNRNTFASVGKDDKVPYGDPFLYAPDCICKDGKYYMYYCTSGANDVEGVAVGNSPIGPFGNGKIIKGCNQIDPAVFIDDDGQAYLYWGQFSAKCAKLKPNMTEIDPQTYKDGIITEKDHFFHEGIQMFKRNGIYYLAYANIQRHGMATCIGYSTSTSPTGPFKYGGIIVDNFGCDPNVWNNHGSVAQFNGQWYVFYHRATHGCVAMRKACVEPITFNADGSINEAEMTTQGAAGPLNPLDQMEAERACFLTGKVRVQAISENNDALTRIENLNTAAYKYFDFKKAPVKFTVKVTPRAGGSIRVFANDLCLPLLTTIEVPAGDGKTPVTLTGEINSDLTGVHPIYLRFIGQDDTDLFDVDWFKFD